MSVRALQGMLQTATRQGPNFSPSQTTQTPVNVVVVLPLGQTATRKGSTTGKGSNCWASQTIQTHIKSHKYHYGLSAGQTATLKGSTPSQTIKHVHKCRCGAAPLATPKGPSFAAFAKNRSLKCRRGCVPGPNWNSERGQTFLQCNQNQP